MKLQSGDFTREIMVSVRSLAKTFVLHTQGGTSIKAFGDLSFDVRRGECLALHGPSGAGKSTLLRSIYANYKPCAGSIRVRHRGTWVDMATDPPHRILEARGLTMGYVSQFLRVIPRVPCLDIVAEGLLAQGTDEGRAKKLAASLLSRLRIAERLWPLAPATFSGGEQQRVNIARCFIRNCPVLLLDEPTASLDAANRQTVLELIAEAKAGGAAVLGIFHDDAARAATADRVLHMNTNV
jgi:alpha-D-ribose 1-methylphosphonate 5-triphosphate synthase subunit PhnL